MRFPLADWIDGHADCRHDLGRSGMVGTVAHPLPSRREVRSASSSELIDSLASILGVDPRRVFLTHGATEANSLVVFYRARPSRGRPPTVRVRFPEYPPLVDVARRAGYRVAGTRGRATLAVVSLPRNPEGLLWSAEELSLWTEEARSTLVDETFREFGRTASLSAAGTRGRWVSGTFTKFYGADDLRVGYVVSPPEEAEAFARFHGVVTDEIAPYSVAGGLRILEERPALSRQVLEVFERNRSVLVRALPATRGIRAPMCFDPAPRRDGSRLARRCLRASVLVCPGRFFGSPAGVRVCLTRRSFPRDLAAYLRVRGPEGPGVRRAREEGGARRRRGDSVRARGARR